jgi:hypothetical protein
MKSIKLFQAGLLTIAVSVIGTVVGGVFASFAWDNAQSLSGGTGALAWLLGLGVWFLTGICFFVGIIMTVIGAIGYLMGRSKVKNKVRL